MPTCDAFDPIAARVSTGKSAGSYRVVFVRSAGCRFHGAECRFRGVGRGFRRSEHLKQDGHSIGRCLALAAASLAHAGKAERDFYAAEVAPAVSTANGTLRQSCGCDVKMDVKQDSFQTVDHLRQVRYAAGTIIDQQIRIGGIISNAVTANKAQVTDLNDRIARAEANILKQENDMRARFSRLESLTSQMQSQQAQLTSALAGLGGGG